MNMRPGLADVYKKATLNVASNFSRSQQIRELPIGLAVLPASLHRDGADARLRFPATVIFDLTFAPVVFFISQFNNPPDEQDRFNLLWCLKYMRSKPS